MKSKISRVAAAAAAMGAAAAALAGGVTQADVGDADSFGRPVIYLGLAQTKPVVIQDDCSRSDPKEERCLLNQPQPAPTNFNERGLATINLPPAATQSLICFDLTPIIDVNWMNLTSSVQLARFAGFAEITIANPALNDPALIDASTGAPFNGVIKLSLNTWMTKHRLAPGEDEMVRSVNTRSCMGGLVSRRSLVETHGLSASEAEKFFLEPMTVSFGVRGSVLLSTATTYFYGVRLYGD